MEAWVQAGGILNRFVPGAAGGIASIAFIRAWEPLSSWASDWFSVWLSRVFKIP